MAELKKPIESYISQNFEEIFTRISFAPTETGKCRNLSAEVHEVVLISGLNTIQHGLGRKPTGYIKLGQSAECSLVDVKLTADEVQLTSSAPATVKLLFI